MSRHTTVRLLANAIAAAPQRGKWRVRRCAGKWIGRWRLNVDHTFHVRRQGLAWELNPSDIVDNDLFWFGEKESGDEQLLLGLARPGAAMLDVGANFGYYSLRLAQRLRGQCTIHAFEPNPPTFARLQRHLKANGVTCIQAHPFGLGETAGSFPIVCSSDNTGGAYLSATGGNDGTNVVTVRVAALDAIQEELAIKRIDLIKVDIEGHEIFFLKGAARLLAETLPPMMIEVNPENLARNGQTAAMLIEQLRAVGYREFFTRTATTTEEFNLGLLEDCHYRNVFCFRQRPEAFPLGAMRRCT